MKPTFASLGLADDLVAALTGLGYEEPTGVQREAIPPLLAGRDVMAQAATGTGKTAAFALPLLSAIAGAARSPGHAAALVLVPTRELAVQVAEAVHRYGAPRGVQVLPIYGGQAYDQQLRALKRGVDVVVATPGRALDHIKRGTLKLDRVKVLVLDEADEMLDMGFEEDLEAIVAALPGERQTALFSATLPPRIAAIGAKSLRDPVKIAVATETHTKGTLPKVRQVAYIVGRAHKPAALGRLLDIESPASAIVFCRTRNEVDELTSTLGARGYRAEPLHGGLSQAQRDRVMAKLRAEQTDLVIATDVAARGLDIRQLSHVINYDVPASPDDYVHRIGRTGRAGRAGVAITLAEPREHRMLGQIERATRQKIEVTALPSVADLRARRLALVAERVREALGGGDLERFRGVAEALAGEFDVIDVAAAAVKLIHDEGTGAGKDDEEIPTVRAPKERPGAPKDGRGKPARGARPETSWKVARLHLDVGRADGVRAADIVGALTHGAGLEGWAVGAIRLENREATVEVPADVAADLVKALKKQNLRGRRVVVKILE